MLNSSVFARQDDIRQMFRGSEPLPEFAMISNFLDAGVFHALLSDVSAASFETYCGYFDNSGNLNSGFEEPTEDRTYITIHSRTRQHLLAFNELFEYFASPSICEFLSKISHKHVLSLRSPAILTSWGPESFLEPHTDAGLLNQPVSLVVSLSLTTNWDRGWSGSTTYSWNNSMFTAWPEANVATIFAPSENTLHWVNQLSQLAPLKRRFTWTLHYD